MLVGECWGYHALPCPISKIVLKAGVRAVPSMESLFEADGGAEMGTVS